MQITKFHIFIILTLIASLIGASDATTNTTLPNQLEGGSNVSLYDYIPMIILFVFSLPVLIIEFMIARGETQLQDSIVKARLSILGRHINNNDIRVPKWSAQDQIRFIGLTIVVFLAVFVITIPNKSFDANLTAALFGFLGTVVGYLAGSSGAQQIAEQQIADKQVARQQAAEQQAARQQAAEQQAARQQTAEQLATKPVTDNK